MDAPHIENALNLKSPESYFEGRTSGDICIPQNIILFSRKTAEELQRRSFESYPHHRFVFLFNLRTNGTVTVDGIQWRLESDQAFLVFPYQFQYFSDFADANVVWLLLTFELENSVDLQLLRNRIINLDSNSLEMLNSIIEDYNDRNTPRVNRRLTLKTAALVNRLREKLHGGPKRALFDNRSAKRTSTELINRIQHYLMNHTGELHSVVSIAESMHMSESNLRTVFRQQFNISLGAYLRNYRAHQAILFMQNPKLSLSNIAFELGFSTLSAFSRFFSSAIGESPREYRKKIAQ